MRTEHARRRDRELSSLYATVRALTALGEVDDVLAAVVEHAHDLMGTDFTYLSVFDDTGKLTLQATQGTFSSGFRTAQVPGNTGVGGRVIDTAAPFWVDDYLADQALQHDEAFDTLVAGEGMKAVLGVPLLISNRVVGVLYAADRYQRTFAPDEVAMLSAFADHAAVALENARLYRASRDALADLQTAYRTIESQVALIERSAAVHEELTRLILAGGNAGQVAQMLVEHLGGRLTVYDRAERITVSRTIPDLHVPEPPRSLPAEISAQARATGRLVDYRGDDDVTHRVTAVLAGSSVLGYLVATAATATHAVDGRTLERSAQILGLLTLTQEALVEAEERVRGELLGQLLNARHTDEGIRARATARGVDIDSLDALVTVDAGPHHVLEVSRRLHALSADWHGIAGEHLGAAVMAFATSDAVSAVRAIHQRLRRELGRPVHVLLGRPGQSGNWHAAHALNRRCQALAQLLQDVDRGAVVGDYATYALVFDPDRAMELHQFLDTAIGPLIDYDQRRSAVLVPTVLAYFQASGNLAAAARDLHVHTNTLLKRLERVSQLIGANWRDAEPALRVHLAVRLHDLARRS